MKADELSKRVDAALKALANALAAGKSATLQAYLSAIGKFHRYSLGNILLILGQIPDATHVCGFHSWRQLGRFVKKGEKGIAIRAPLITNNEDAQTFEVRGFKVAWVYDISQTDGEPLPELNTIRGDPGEYLPRLCDFAAHRGIAIEYSDGIAPAKGRSSGGKITLLPDLHPAEHFHVLCHELAHELLHQEKGQRMPPAKVRETEAEAVAFAVVHEVALDSRTAAVDYIQLYQGDTATLTDSLTRIHKTAALILQEIQHPVQRPEPVSDVERLDGQELSL